MKHLLDVNALVAWWHQRSPHHEIFHAWAARTGFPQLATCAHVELGFIRVSMQVFGYALPDAQKALAEMKRQVGGFIPAAPAPKLAAWASTAHKTSDAYLAQLAKTAGLSLATFDTAIPGAIPIR